MSSTRIRSVGTRQGHTCVLRNVFPRPLAAFLPASIFLHSIFLLSIFSPPIFALDPHKTLTQYAHRIWGQEEGLFQPTIYSILQGRDGFLWLGTQDSLIRFDGTHFREFEAGNEAVFHHDLIRALAEDGVGNLWVGSIGAGAARITPAGALTRFTTKEGLPSDIVLCLDAQGGDEMWACTNQGLARFTSGKLSSGRFEAFTTSDGLPSNQVRSTCATPAGVRWVAGVDFALSRSSGSRFETYSDPLLRPKEGVTALMCAKDGSVWAGTEGGAVQIQAGSSRLLAMRDGLPDNAVAALMEGPDGSIWIGTNDGVSRFRDGQISVYATRDGLSHSQVSSLYMDREGSLWAGTKDGLDQFTDGKVTPFTTSEGLTSNDVGPVFEDAAGRLWIGTLGKGLNYFDGAHFHSLTRRDGLSDDRILSLEGGADGDLWVGTAKGLDRVRNGAVVESYTTRNGLSGAAIHSLLLDSEGTLWVGTERGLDHLNGTRFVTTTVDPQSGAGDVLALAGSHATRLFVSTDLPGFYALRNGTMASYSMAVARPVDCYFLDPIHRTAWMGTLGSGLIRWHNGTIDHVHVKDGLYDNRIYSILKDDHGNLWMASSKGIFRVSEKELDDFADGKTHFVTSIPFSTGQLRFECRSGVQPAAYRTRDGRLWFSTTNGLVVVDPNHLVSNNVPPTVQITSIIVNGRRMDVRGELKVMPWEEKNLEIRYAGLTFLSPEKVSFRYILGGYDKQWTDAGARREALFTNLPPGHFQFKVLARNADGIWSKQAASLALTIEPRLYQRSWFFPLLAVLLGLAIALGYRVRIRHLNNRFAVVLAERNRIARELHDTLLQGLSGITMQLQAVWTRLPVSKEKQFLGEIIKDAARCSQEARQSLWGLRASRPGAPDFSEHLATVARQAVEGKPISLLLDLQPVSLRSTPGIEFQLLRIAQETISNTLAHAHAATLKIQLRRDEHELCLAVEDDGAGFSTGAEQPFGHYGLTGMQERANEIRARLNVTSAPDSGTKVEVRVPLSASALPDRNAGAGLEHQYR